jgi:peptidoglycan/xylan/chitin deacetylase (PgdA/CDA1 family)
MSCITLGTRPVDAPVANRYLLLLAVLAGASTAGRDARQQSRMVAVTFDDLPVAAHRGITVDSQLHITRALLAAVTRHRVPAIGFVNEIKLNGRQNPDSARIAVLRLWVRAGLDLGSHTYSHSDLHTVPLAQYEQDITRSDAVTRPMLRAVGRTPHWFRHPYLHTGRDSATRHAVDRTLARLGYRVAPVTIDNHDYIFANAYENAGARGDTTLLRQIPNEYVEYMERVFAYYEEQSDALFGRQIRQVLLLHASALNATCFDELARMMERRGYRFVSLDGAVEDSAYRSADRYYGPAGITWLHRWALSRTPRGRIVPGEPEVPSHILQSSTP